MSRHSSRPAALLLLLAVALLAFTVVLARPTAADADELLNVTRDVPASVWGNPCTGEPVNLSGRIHIVIYVRSDNQGGWHVTTHEDVELSGVGLVSGADYQASTTHDKDSYARAPFPYIETMTFNDEVLSQGAAENFVMHHDVHLTVTANGIPTATVDNLRVGCRG